MHVPNLQKTILLGVSRDNTALLTYHLTLYFSYMYNTYSRTLVIKINATNEYLHQILFTEL